MIRKDDILFRKFIRLISENYDTLTPEETIAIKDALSFRTFKKNEIIIEEGLLTPKLCFLIDGCVRVYINQGGQDRTTFFYTKGDFLWRGREKRLGSLIVGNYQAVEKCSVAIFDLDKLPKLFELYPKFEKISRMWIDIELMRCQNLITNFVTLSPENRYIKLMSSNGELFQKVPQKYIASYLGVSAETLSRIKNRVYQKIREERALLYQKNAC